LGSNSYESDFVKCAFIFFFFSFSISSFSPSSSSSSSFFFLFFFYYWAPVAGATGMYRSLIGLLY
jgi:hypothetical protein